MNININSHIINELFNFSDVEEIKKLIYIYRNEYTLIRNINSTISVDNLSIILNYILSLDKNWNNILWFDKLCRLDKLFLHACELGYTEIVRILSKVLDKDGMNIKDEYGSTGFIWACCNGYTEIVRILSKVLDKDSINMKDDEGISGYMFACWNEHTKIIEIIRSIKSRG